ncbi:MAG: hypothetical protein ACETVY_00645, partial [Candidatus Bathyarchaeia archaeon]
MEALKRLGERSSVFILAVISALRGTLNNMRMVIWQPFVLSLGVPISGLGGLESLMSLIRILIQPVFGNASDIYGRKKFLIFRDLLAISAGLLFVFSRSMRLLFPGVVLISLSIALLPIWATV